jgi:hypothetical protein
MEELSQSPINKFKDPSLGVYNNILGLNIPVHDAPRVTIVQSLINVTEVVKPSITQTSRI